MKIKRISMSKPSAALAGIVTAATLAFGGVSTADAQTQVGQPPAVRAPVRDPGHVFRRFPKSWTEIKRQNVVMQERDFSCGAAALATMFQYHLGVRVTERQILQTADKMLTQEEIIDRLQNGLSMTDLRRLAVELGYEASTTRLSLQQLSEAKTPLIVGIIVNEYDHFVVYRGIDSQYIYLADPARGNLRVPIREFVAQWQQNLALVVAPKDGEPITWSPLMLQWEETTLGQLNREYVRRRMTNAASGTSRK